MYHFAQTDEEIERVVDPDGTILYYNAAGKLHREDGPAVEYADGDKAWYIDGKLHREDGPAVEYADGDKEWYIDGKCHREDGPAIERADGYKAWYINGKLHREDGPAVEYADGTKKWYIDGKRHREDGPAIEWADGSKEWYIDGELHREDGPAVEWADGSKEWYIDGKCHREDGPAVEYADGSKEWYIDGKLHREDGPAVEDADGYKYWYIDGKFIKIETPLMKPLEDIYELTYKYQMLKQEQERGDYGLPQVLPDQAYLEFEKVKQDLEYNLDSIYSDIVNTYEEWLDRHSGGLGAYAMVEDMYNRFNSEYLDQDLDNKIILFQEALTTAHNNGQMADHLLGLEDGEGVEFLSNLSENSPVEEWDSEIGSVLGYDPGTRKEQDTMYIPRAFKYLKAAIQLLLHLEIQ